jgi:hypothetical protein
LKINLPFKAGYIFRKRRLNLAFEKGLASIAVCLIGAYSMRITDGGTGVGWAILGLMFIWAN